MNTLVCVCVLYLCACILMFNMKKYFSKYFADVDTACFVYSINVYI